MKTDVPDDFMEEGTEVVTGREPPPHTQAPDWIRFSPISSSAKELHTVLKAHVNQVRGDTVVWPSTRSLAKILGLSRRDRVSPLLKELVSIEAIEIKRHGMPARNIYVVHSLPPAGYAGPLSVSEWYVRNREALNAEAAADKSKRDERASRNKASDTEQQVTPVTPDTGQQPVTPDTGQLVDATAGQHVAPPAGRKQEEEEQDEEKEEKPAGPADRRGDSKPAAIQTTIDGSDEALPEKTAPTTTQVAFGLADVWINWWASRGTPIAANNPKHQLKSLVKQFLDAEYTETELKDALRSLNEPIPTKPQLQRELIRARGGSAGSAVRPQQRAGAKVNGYWDQVREAEAGNGHDMAAVGADVQTTGAKW